MVNGSKKTLQLVIGSTTLNIATGTKGRITVRQEVLKKARVLYAACAPLPH